MTELPCFVVRKVSSDGWRCSTCERDVDGPLGFLNACPNLSKDPTERVEATTTPEGREGWEQPRHPELMGEGGHDQDGGTDAIPRGVRADTRDEQSGSGGDPGSAPTAAARTPLRGPLIALRCVWLILLLVPALALAIPAFALGVVWCLGDSLCDRWLS